jgi:hypothetical protein
MDRVNSDVSYDLHGDVILNSSRGQHIAVVIRVFQDPLWLACWFHIKPQFY